MQQNGHFPQVGDPPIGDPLASSIFADLPLSPYSTHDVIEMVDTHERDVTPLRQRMESDYDRYRLKSHVNRDSVTGEPLKNYAVYTSNMPRVFADKVISWMTLAELLVRVPHIYPETHQPETDNLKERFAIGNLRAANERLRNRRAPSLRGQLAFYTTVMGGYIGGRCLLVNRPDGTAYADITAWNPMNIHFGIGEDGLEWVCHKQKMTRAEIKREYKVDLGGTGPGWSTDAEATGLWVYDFYDEFTNHVVAEGDIVLKPPTLHGSPRVPVYLTLVGSTPLFQSQGHSNVVADIGESVYAGVREVYEKNNSIMSIMLEIVERARRQTVITESKDGKKTLPEDPFKQGVEIAVAQGERIYTLELQKMAQETAVYMTTVAGEIQRATLPYSSYGETPFQLSGFAITQLRQATETVLASRFAALEECYLQMANLLYDQFMTGFFPGMRLSGRDANRSYFNEMMSPDMIGESCDYTVKVVAQLPQDDASRWSQAKIAKDLNIIPDVDILDDVLGYQDSQQVIDKKRSELAETGLPEAVLYTMMMAAANRGEKVLANMYLGEFQRLMAQKLGVIPPVPGTDGKPSPNGAQNQGPQGGGQPPEVLPNAATGAPPQPETSNNGPSYVAPGTPRPGARGQKA